MTAEWKFARRLDRCSDCEQPFEEGTRHVSSLSLTGEDLARTDVCLSCWDARGAGPDLFHWYTRWQQGRRGLQLDLPMLEQLFHRLDGHAEERMVELRYVLCLLLMRKKRLKLVRVARGGSSGGAQEALLVRRPRRDESIRVLVRDLPPERIETMRQELCEIFDGAELPGPEAGGAGVEEGSEEAPPRVGAEA